MFNYLIARLHKKDRGFTLIEVIVVIGILAVLSALAIPAVGGYLDKSKAQTNFSNAKLIYNAANAYLASTPNAPELATGDITDILVTQNYIAKEPKTSGGASYDISSTDKVVTVTWTSETALAIEGNAAASGNAANAAKNTALAYK